MSLMAFFYLPLLFGAVSMSYYFAEHGRIPLRKIVLVGIALSAYFLVWVPGHYWTMQGLIAGWSLESSWPNDLVGIARFVFGSPPGMSGTIAIVSLGVLAALKKWRVVGWLLIWSALILVPLSFSSISSWVSTYITSRNAFWRILYILPTLLCIGLGVGELYKRFFVHRRSMAYVYAVLVITVIFLNSSEASIGPWAKNGVSFPILRPKLPEEGVAYSQEIVNTLQPGPMIAPEEVSQILPIL